MTSPGNTHVLSQPTPPDPCFGLQQQNKYLVSDTYFATRWEKMEKVLSTI